MKILAYKGISLVSKAIKWQTRSQYSHIGVMLSDGTCIEAWHKGGVRRISGPKQGHAPGTRIDVYRVKAPFNTIAAERWLKKQVGKKYDYRSVARFLTRRDTVANDRFFCSELAEIALMEGGLRLLNGNPSHHSPRDTAMSPYLVFEDSI